MPIPIYSGSRRLGMLRDHSAPYNATTLLVRIPPPPSTQYGNGEPVRLFLETHKGAEDERRAILPATVDPADFERVPGFEKESSE